MKKKNVLLIHHSPSENTINLSKHVENKIDTSIPNVNFKMLNMIEANPSNFKDIDGLIIGTTENFGYMSGLTKDFFDRCYDELKDKTEGLPIIYYVRAGLDGEGCKVALNKILIGLRWRQVLPPLVLKGSWQKDYFKQLEKFVLTFASGIELGIYWSLFGNDGMFFKPFNRAFWKLTIALLELEFELANPSKKLLTSFSKIAIVLFGS